MSSKNTHIGLLVLLAAMVAAGVYLYQELPDQVATHWNAAGEADGYSGKFWGIFLTPALVAGLYVLYALIPRIDPLRANIHSFRAHYNAFFLGIAGFMTYLFLLQAAWNLGHRFDFGTAMLPACAVFLWLVGVLLTRAKRNWFVGIRTPWTLSSDKVWDKTHALGGRLFKGAAVITLLGIPFGGAVGFWFFIVPLIAITIITLLYSYVVYLRR